MTSPGTSYEPQPSFTEIVPNPEIEHITQQVGLTTGTLYRDWYPGEVPEGEHPSESKLRGDLAVQTIQAASNQGFRVIVVDGGSSPDFIDAISRGSVSVLAQEEEGMSKGRQQAFRAAAALDGIKVIGWIEPEKLSMATDNLVDPAKAILDGEADVVLPCRNQEAFDTYPDFQVGFEQESNRLYNGLLRRFGLYPIDAPDLDAWFGPRFFKNSPEILELFTVDYQFVDEKVTGLDQQAPGLWANALFLPIVAALHQGHRVKSVPVEYRHPAEQTEFEMSNARFVDKRAFQQRAILFTVVHFIRYLQGVGNPRIQKNN
jgi:hypothetical protein